MTEYQYTGDWAGAVERRRRAFRIEQRYKFVVLGSNGRKQEREREKSDITDMQVEILGAVGKDTLKVAQRHPSLPIKNNHTEATDIVKR